MRRRHIIISSIILILLCFTSVQAKAPMTVKMGKGEAQVMAVKGRCDVVCPGGKAARLLKADDFIGAGCEVLTGENSRLEMMLPDKSIVRFSEKTKFKLIQAEIKSDGKRKVGISVTIGKIWTNVRKALTGRDDKFEISCQNAVAGVRGTIYRMDVESDQSAMVKVYDGEVSVAGVPKAPKQPVSVAGAPQPVAGPSVVEGPKPVSMEQWVYIVKSMQKIQITADGQAKEPEDFTEASEETDDWVQWNKNRDRKQER